MKTRTLYDVLQIAPNAAPPIVDAAYEHLRMHFDLRDDRAGGRLVDDAYTTLRDPALRLAYDAKLAQVAREIESQRASASPVRRPVQWRSALAGWAVAAAIGFGSASLWHATQARPTAPQRAEAPQTRLAAPMTSQTREAVQR